ncbi:MAG: hypothetical protein ACKVPJ_01865 [Chitinophagales bacterium]
MKKNKDIVWIVLGVLLLGGLILLLFSMNERRYNWNETYYINDEEPFCNSVLLELAETYFPGKELGVVNRNIYRVMDTIQSLDHKNYFFSGYTFFMDDTTLNKFLEFIYKGNDAFISANSFSDEVAEELFRSVENQVPSSDSLSKSLDDSLEESFSYGDYLDEDNNTSFKSMLHTSPAQNINLNFVQKDFSTVNGYPYTYTIRDEPRTYNWKYFTEEFMLKEGKSYEMNPLGKVSSGGYNFIELKHGRGTIYFFTTPLLLTNMYLIEKENLDYTSKLLSHLKPGDIIWDEYSKRRHGGDYMPPSSEGPLGFILSQQSLRWAWYLLLTGLLTFLVFKGKRMQQAIPVTEPNINKSLEFSQTIGRMHYLSRNTKNLARQKMKLFQHHIKERYRLPAHDPNDILFQKLSMHAQLPEKDIRHIFTTYKYIEAQNSISDDDIIDFHNLLDTYYKNCK